MTDKMLKFVEIGQQTPPKREIDVRKKDFNEIYDEFISEKAKEQSSRCSHFAQSVLWTYSSTNFWHIICTLR